VKGSEMDRKLRKVILIFAIVLAGISNLSAIVLVNSDFEYPVIGEPPPYPTIVWNEHIMDFNDSDVPGWVTTATDRQIEMWENGNGLADAYEGTQFIELNANEVASLYQDINTTPDSNISWSIAHRGRAGTDVADVYIGAPGGTMTMQARMTTSKTSWKVYNGTYHVPAGQTVTRIEFRAVSAAGGDTVGNFLDSFIVTAGDIIAYDNEYSINVGRNSELTGNVITDSPADYGGEKYIDTWTQPSHGTLSEITHGGDGNFTYTPDEGFVGIDTFDYNITDSYGSKSKATVTIRVKNFSAESDYYRGRSDHDITGNVLDNDRGESLRVVHTWSPSHGSVTMNRDGTFTYTPDAGYVGNDKFRYRVKDADKERDTAWVYLTILDNSVVAEYRLDECGYDGTTGDVKDHTVNGLDGTSESLDKNESALICSAAYFDGQTANIKVPHDSRFDIKDGVTIYFWLYPKSSSSGTSGGGFISPFPGFTKEIFFISKYDSGGDGWYIYEENLFMFGNKITFSLSIDGRENSVSVDKPSEWEDKWHLIVARYDSTDGMSIVIKDSSGSDEDTDSTTGDIDNSDEPLLMGKKYDDTAYFRGYLDEVKIWNRALEDTEIDDYYERESKGKNWNGSARVCPTCFCTAPAQKGILSSMQADFRKMTDGKSVKDILSPYFGENYGSEWMLWRRDYDVGEAPDGANDARYYAMGLDDDLEYGKAYWIKNYTAVDVNYSTSIPTMDFNATIDDYPECRSDNGKCTIVDLVEPNGTENHGPYIYTMTSFPISVPIAWKDVRVMIDDKIYTPEQAQKLGRTFNATIWRYNPDTGSYEAVAPDTAGIPSVIEPCRGYWIELDKNSAGKDVRLLIPQE
jgi:hypothetical protein